MNMHGNATSPISVTDVEARPVRRVRPVEAPRRRRPGSWLARLWKRREPTLYQRCLAVHIHHAGPRSALS
jgi:hypothetical protein